MPCRPIAVVLLYLAASGILFAAAPSARAAAPAQDPTLCEPGHQQAVYQQMFARDQGPRNEYMAEMAAPGKQDHDERIAQLTTRILKADEENQKDLARLVGACGWPASPVFANSNLEAAFLTVQHAPLPYQLEYADLLKKSFAAGQIPSNAYVLFEERIRARQQKAAPAE